MPAPHQLRIAVPAELSPGALLGHDPAAPVIDLGGATMGTLWRVKLAAPAGCDRAALAQAIEARLDGLVAEMSHWEAGSVLARFNGAPPGSWTALPSDFAAVMEAALGLADITDGAFDPALGTLVNLWGFGPLAVAGLPDVAAIEAARAASGWRRLAYDASARRLRQPGGLALDLSGIAKGYAVDAVADLLGRNGVRHCLVEIGGELAGRGLRPDVEPWWVDLEAPPGTHLRPFRVALHDLAVATSGDYVRGNHNIDPASGHPAKHGVISASVLHKSAMLADAWASALTISGAEDGLRLASAEGIAMRIVTRNADQVVETISPALDALL